MFLRWVKSILKSDENFARFLTLYRPPVATNELVESIYSPFEKVFSTNDSFERFEFTDPSLEGDIQEYRRVIGDPSFWQTQGFETLKTSVDNMLVVDLPRLQYDIERGEFTQLTERPEPYYFMLDIANVIDVENKKVKASDTLAGKPFYYFKTEYLIFWDTDTDVCVIDDTYYRRFVWDREKNAVPSLVSEVPHNLGYCPARSFWTTPLNSKSRILKRAPITYSLSELDWFLFFTIAGKYLKTYAPFPIYAVYKGRCNYSDEATKKKCVNGVMVAQGGRPESSKEPCPRCANKLKIGPGTLLEFNPPSDKDQPDLLQNPVKIIPAETESLSAVDKELDRVKLSIYDSCVGVGSDIVKKEAVNEDQVKAGFESKTNVLLGIKKNFEIIQGFALDTICRLRYGDKYKGMTLIYGENFFGIDENEKDAEYKIAKESGLPEVELDARREEMIEARYRNNPDQLERMRILKALDPFPDKNLEEVLKIKDMSDPIDVMLKAHFIRLVERFERENTSLVTFGKLIDFDKKVNQIIEVLRGYATEIKGKVKEPAAPPPGPLGPGAPPVPPPGGPPKPEPVPEPVA